ncbi:MAG: HAD family phosphatase [Chloroflexi bacterium]|nr:MAG: HAD family phosphatase [Chloroflexota bacterium]
MLSIKAVIFDLGGVLVRTEDRMPRTKLAERFGLTYEQIDKLVFNSETATRAAMGEIDVHEHWKTICSELNAPVEEAQAVAQAFWGGDRLDHTLVDFIRSLRSRWKTALLSNHWSHLRAELQERWEILDAFDEVIISAEVGLAKPGKEIFELVVQRLGVEPGEAVFVDDFRENIEGARAAGLEAILFKNTEQTIRDLQTYLKL